MNMTAKISIGAFLVVTLCFGAYFVGRKAGSDTAPVPAPREKAKVAHHADDDDGCLRPPEERRPVTAEDKARATEELGSIPDQIRKLAAANQFDKLNELQAYLSANLAEGKISPEQILDMYRNEKDMSVLDVLMGVLKANPEIANQPEVIGAFLRFAKDDPLIERRHAAIAFLGNAWDRDGQVRSALLAIAKNDPEPNLRNAAIAVFKEYTVRNPDAAAAVNSELLTLAQSTADSTLRMVALSSVDIRAGDEATVRAVGDYLTKDATAEVRLAAAEQLGEVKPAFRNYAMTQLEEAFNRETADGVRSLIVASLVKAGRADSLPALRRLAERDGPERQNLLDYVQILQAGEVDWERINDEKRKLETSRGK